MKEDMYKKASRLKTRFESKFGLLSVEQCWDLKLDDLKELIKKSYEEKKKVGQVDEDLSFLEGSADISEKERKKIHAINLKFEILKDIWETRLNEISEKSANTRKKMEINHLEQILAEKREANLRGLSEEELLKLIDEKSKK